MKSIYDRAKSAAGYNAIILLRMLGDMGGGDTARLLVRTPQVSSSFVGLWARRCMVLRVEAQPLSHPDCWELSGPRNLDNARRWLKEYGYDRL